MILSLQKVHDYYYCRYYFDNSNSADPANLIMDIKTADMTYCDIHH